VASFKSGEYIAEVLDIIGPKVLIQTLAVHKFPLQGDLHHPYQANVPVFHQRKALSYRERVMVPQNTIIPFNGEVPDYTDSLKSALEADLQEFRSRSGKWEEMAVTALEELKKEYFPK
ncbi:sporulation phosphorelay system protein KapB, partial [Brevibacillus sp. SYSU BS000544]|uniref:sporulation phosphorelay system protein KapB n=1 Tax=Brevibacillus sp. SYSU BS000544 TaxID=3416443 RepID=UPI003CE44F03